MANKKFWLGILVIVLVFGMTVVGCDNGSTSGGSKGGGGADTWSDVTSLSQLNGTWKGSATLTSTEQGITMRMTMEMTMTITATNATTGERSGTQKMTITFSGNSINTYWSDIKEGYPSEEGWTVNDSTYSVTTTDTIPSEPISMSDMNGAQINQNGTKVKVPAGIMDEDSPQIIFIKQ
jgi:hypothetical protein